MFNTNIAFSQVREDPELDLLVLESIKTKDKKALVIGSGGCSILTLLLDQNIEKLDVIDANIDQIELIKLKIALLKNSNTQEFIQFTEGQNINYRNKFLNNIKNDEFFNKEYWKEPHNFNQLISGINQAGVFERLFKNLRDEFTDCPMLIENNDEWDAAFETVFNRSNLISAFGENAVKYSMSKEFTEHFSEVMSKAIKKYQFENNYFLDQIFKGQYNEDLPIFLDEENKKIILSNLHKLNFINKPFHEYVKETNQTYDFIHTSNITDWLPLDILDGMYKDIYTKLNVKGKVMSRRLNGDHSLIDIVGKIFQTSKNALRDHAVSYQTRFTENDLIDLKEEDKSFFYNEVFFGEKK